MLSVGPANFYQTTSFCDYPPAYVYIMGLNAALMRVLPLSAAAVHKLIPIPFFIEGGTMLATGRGEVLTKLEDMPETWLLVKLPIWPIAHLVFN